MMKPIRMVFMLVIMVALSCTVLTPVQAGFNGSVKSCMENPEECEQPTAEQNTTDNETTVTEVGPTVTFLDYLKMVLALIFVVGLIYFLLKFINQRSRSFQQTKLIHHLGGSPLGGNRSVQLVKVGKRVLILGVGEDIQLLKEIETEEEKEEILNFYNDSSTQLTNSKDALTNWVQSKLSGKKSDTPSTEQKPFQSILKGQLDELRQGRKKLLDEIEGKENSKDE